MLRKGVSWADVPAERVGCSGVTARRLRNWTEADVRPRPHEAPPAELRKAGLLEMDGAAVDGSHVRAPRERGLTPGLCRSTAAVREAGTPDHRPERAPLAVSPTGGNRHVVTRPTPLLGRDRAPSRDPWPPRHRPGRPFTDRGYDYDT
ncbi:hypothetical protein GCM10019016_105080 [Streptomyces prasinosporus]|uniref:Transposase n=1 Tax=Streptomyces prasinosporus TaxID=68256 RepID=A0ABP6U9M2_9ACTN